MNNLIIDKIECFRGEKIWNTSDHLSGQNPGNRKKVLVFDTASTDFLSPSPVEICTNYQTGKRVFSGIGAYPDYLRKNGT